MMRLGSFRNVWTQVLSKGGLALVGLCVTACASSAEFRGDTEASSGSGSGSGGLTSSSGSTSSSSASNPDDTGQPMRFPADAVDLNPDPDIVEIALRPQRHLYQVGYRTVQGYGFNGQVPGPTIRMQKGQLLRVRYENGIDAPSTVHWHGVDAPFEMDGVTWKGKPIMPGESFVYEFRVQQSGTFWYHPHFDTQRQVDLGLYGALVVSDPAEPRADYDLVMFFDVWNEIEGSHISPERPSGGGGGDSGDHGGHGQGHFAGSTPWQDDGHGDHGEGPGPGQTPGKVVWSVNNQIQPKLVLPEGKSVRARMINVSNMGYLKLYGLPGQRIASDQGLLAAPMSPEGLLLTPGDRADIGGIEGVVEVKNRQYSMFGPGVDVLPESLRYPVFSIEAGRPGSAPALAYPFSYQKPSEDPLVTDVLYTFQGDPRTGSWSINGERFPNITVKSIPLGKRSHIELRNISGSEHPFHMHGHPFEVLSVDGVAPLFRRIEDTWNVKNLQRVRIAVDAYNPGDWMTHCHILSHAEEGMMTVLRAE